MSTKKYKVKTRCNIPGCKTIFGEDKTIKCHKIRKSVLDSQKEKSKWMAALPFLKRVDFMKKKYLMCSRHFKEEDYIIRPLKNFKREKDLKPSAMPTLHLPSMMEINQSHEEKKKKIKKKLNNLKLQTYELKEIFLKEKLNNVKPENNCKCSRLANTNTIGIQCEIIKAGNDSINKNSEIVHHIQREVEKKQLFHDTGIFRPTYDKKILRNPDKTCDLPNDDEFFNEILQAQTETEIKTALGSNFCKHCGLTFTDIKTYAQHEGVHSELSLLCCFCGFKSVDYFKNIEHEYDCKKKPLMKVVKLSCKKKKTRNKPVNEKPIKSECESRNENLPVLHNRTMEDNLKFDSIVVESDSFENDGKESNISKVSEPNELVELICDICHAFFDDKEVYKKHLLRKHFLNEEDVDSSRHVRTKIEYQLSGTTTIEFLKLPTEEHACKICPKSFMSEYLLERHINTQHMNPVKKLQYIFQCHECDMNFRNSKKLQSHIREHVISEKHCKICNIINDNNQDYLKHLLNPRHLALEQQWKQHYNVNHFLCSLCKTEETKYYKLVDLANHSDYHRISKTRIFINSKIAEHEFNTLANTFDNKILP